MIDCNGVAMLPPLSAEMRLYWEWKTTTPKAIPTFYGYGDTDTHDTDCDGACDGAS